MATIASASKEYTFKVVLTIGEKLYLNEEMADFHFVFESDDGLFERIPAHKNFLATASDVFGIMFNGTWEETKEVKIVDALPSAFREFLQFSYLERVKVSMENVAQVMNLGEKYNVAECLKVCQDFLKYTLTNEIMCWGYGITIHLNEKDLMEFCEENIKNHASEVFASASFLDCDRKVLRHILKLNLLFCTGAELIEEYMSWLKSASKQEHLKRKIIQDYLGDLFYEIPFGSMLLKDFAEFDRSYEGLLTYEGHREIIQMIASTNFQPKIFSEHRKTLFGYSPKWNKNAVITCDRRIWKTKSPYFIKNIETTTFSTDRAILLCAIICEELSEWNYNGYHYTVKIPTEITITEIFESTTSGEKVVVYNGKANLDNHTDTRIQLPQPIPIKPGFVYEIRMKQDPPENCCTRFSLTSEVEIEPGTIVKSHRSNEESDEAMRGLIWILEFNRI
ncbi:BTB/POZ domain-containing protein 6-B-like [Sitodiplosis mosellana]|uniref:BTB/POZ domain-containing protein 6-B-like n=1 Tax=Sitodiplosis mosellana TaxID=263140 RepID=UPI0024441527|nr:BTB/POZ domain-containing protein 6-B-like [Sitodiplosis mosellana]